MFESETTLVNFAIGYLKTITADLKDDDLTTLTESTGKTPQWILGHLRIAAELGSDRGAKRQLVTNLCNLLGHWFAAYWRRTSGTGNRTGTLLATRAQCERLTNIMSLT